MGINNTQDYLQKKPDQSNCKSGTIITGYTSIVLLYLFWKMVIGISTPAFKRVNWRGNATIQFQLELT